MSQVKQQVCGGKCFRLIWQKGEMSQDLVEGKNLLMLPGEHERAEVAERFIGHR